MVFGLGWTFDSIVRWSLRIGTTFLWTQGTLFHQRQFLFSMLILLNVECVKSPFRFDFVSY